MRNQRGVTLIALVITIIVLLILAGVSIAMLTGDNGILTQANKAQVTTIEGNVAEAVRLAVQAAKMDAEQKAIANTTTWAAEGHTDEVIDVLEEDLKDGYTVSGTGATITIVYAGSDYAKATNTTGASITYTLTLSGTSFSLGAPVYNPTK